MKGRGLFRLRVATGCGLVMWGMLAAAPAPSPLTAQNIGDRVRVFSGGTTTIGEVTVVTGEGFDLLNRGHRLSFKFGQIYRLERSLGARHPWKKGLAYGAGGGFPAGRERRRAGPGRGGREESAGSAPAGTTAPSARSEWPRSSR